MKKSVILFLLGISALSNAQFDISIIGDDSTCIGQSSVYSVEVSGYDNNYFFRDTVATNSVGNGYYALNTEYDFLDITNTFSYDLWVKPTRTINMAGESNVCPGGVSVPLANSNQNWAIVPAGLGDGNLSVGLTVGTNGLMVGEHSGNILVSRLSYGVSISDWVHVAIVYRTDSIFLFLNGELVRSRVTHCASNLKCLAKGLTGYYYSPDFKGNIDEFRLWDMPLTETQVRNIMDKKLINQVDGLRYYASFDNGSFERTLGDLGTAKMTVAGSVTSDNHIKKSSWEFVPYTGLSIGDLSEFTLDEFNYKWHDGNTSSSLNFHPMDSLNYISVEIYNSNYSMMDSLKVIGIDCGQGVLFDTIYIHDTIYINNCDQYTPENIRFLKYESYYSEDQSQVNVYELEAYSSGSNVALNKPITTNSGSSPGSANDGNQGSRWESNRNDPGPDSINPHYILLDLIEKYKIDSLILNIEGFDHWKQDFSLQGSPDLVTWHEIGYGSDTTGIFTFYPNNFTFRNDTVYIEIKDTIYTEVHDTIYTYVPTSGISQQNLVSYYPFNGNAFDLGSSKKDGIVNGAVLTTDKDGNNNSAYYFDGVDDHIIIPDSLHITDDFTISFWAYNERTSGYSNILSDGSSSALGNDFLINFKDSNIGIRADKSGKSLNYENSSPAELTGLELINTWVHITWAMKPDYSKVYLNGEEIAHISKAGTNLGYHDANSYIGARNVWGSPDNFFKGKLDELKIYNTALDGNQVKSLYLNTACVETIYDTIFTEVFDTAYVTIIDTITTEVFQNVYVAVSDTLIIDAVLTDVGVNASVNTIKVYPNPARDQLFINTGDYLTMNGYRLKIINQMGLTVFETLVNDPLYEIDLSTWSGYGMYYLQVIDSIGSIMDIRKIILK